MSAHTPGPWVCTKYWDDMARRNDWLVMFPNGEDASVLTEADAHLISAAPDLLAALEAVSDDAHEEHAKGWTDVPMNCQHEKCVMVRAAIAKATGQPA